MKLLITEEHLKLGKRCSLRGCPIALALGGVLRPEYYCSVGGGALSIYREGPERTKFPIHAQAHPPLVMDFINGFDHGSRKLEPIELLMPDLPAHLMR